MKKVLKFPELNAKVIITPDEFSNPRTDWDNVSKMVCFHRRYSLGDKHNYNSNDYNGWDEMEKAIIKNENVAVILPIYMYEHGNITISTSPFSCRWDSGQIGFIYITKKDAIENWGKKVCTPKVKEMAIKSLENEVEEYDTYLRGEVYHFKAKTIDTKEEFDSCGGFYGDRNDNGIFDNLNVEGLTLERYSEVFDDADWKN